MGARVLSGNNKSQSMLDEGKLTGPRNEPLGTPPAGEGGGVGYQVALKLSNVLGKPHAMSCHRKGCLR